MKDSLLLVDVTSPGGGTEAEPMHVQTDGRLAVIDLNGVGRIAVRVEELMDALTLDADQRRAAA